MLDATPKVVGTEAAPTWQFAMTVLWESGFRIGDLLDFSWDDERHIHPVWPSRVDQHPTIVIPSSQKNGRTQEIPMLPGLAKLLATVPGIDRKGWVSNPAPAARADAENSDKFKPCAEDLQAFAQRYSNLAIANACGVTETAVRKWLIELKFNRDHVTGQLGSHAPKGDVTAARTRAAIKRRPGRRTAVRLTKEHVGRVIAFIGEQAGVVVQRADQRTGQRTKFASAHDLRRGCALRLINSGVSAETLKVVMRHKDFATTEKHYGAMRSAQSAACEVHAKLNANATNDALVGGLMGGPEPAPQLS